MQLVEDKPISPETKAGQEPNYFKIYSKDPSPWNFDNEIWTKLLLKIARGEGFHSLFNMKALGTLHTVRRFGAMIRWDMHRGYILIPEMELGVWETLEYWDYCKKTYFMEYAEIWRHWFSFIDQ